MSAEKISVISCKKWNFLMFAEPNDSNAEEYIKVPPILLTQKNCISHNVKHIVRACEPSYSTKPFEEAGIRVHVTSLVISR
jgi:hypothetical protein